MRFKKTLYILNSTYCLSVFAFSFLCCFGALSIHIGNFTITLFSFTLFVFITNYIDDFCSSNKFNLSILNICLLIMTVCFIFILCVTRNISIPNVAYPFVVEHATVIDGLYLSIINGFLPYFFICICRKIAFSKKRMLFCIFTYIVFVYVLIIYSVSIEYSKYVSILNSFFRNISDPCSAHLNKNIFGGILFAGIVSVIFVHYLFMRKWILLLCLPFFIDIPFTNCKASLIISILLFFCYLIIINLSNFKKYKKITIFLFLFSILILTILVIFDLKQNESIIKKIYFQLLPTFKSRINIWICVLNYLKPLDYLFGLGFSRGRLIIYFLCGNNPPSFEFVAHSHNGFIEIILNGGLFLFFIFVLILILCLKKIRKIGKDKFIFFVRVLFFLLIYSIFEPIMFLMGYSYASFIFVLPITAFLILIINYYHQVNSQVIFVKPLSNNDGLK